MMRMAQHGTNPPFRNGWILLLILFFSVFESPGQIMKAGSGGEVNADPPFSGTIFIDPGIITGADPTAYESLSSTGQGSRLMFDRRANAFITVNAYLFNASYDDGLSIEIQVNPEFGTASLAMLEAEKYAPVIGRLPTALRKDVQTVWIHKGVQPFGGGNNNLLIHVGQADLYEQDGILKETLVHEASHSSLDADHASAPGWVAAQTADGEFISTYASDFPAREDVAESFLTYLAVRFKSDRISQQLFDTIVQTIPNRIAYFDARSLDMYPVQSSSVHIERASKELPDNFNLDQNYPNPFSSETVIPFDLEAPTYLSLDVFDLTGRKVDTLVAGNFPAGRFKVRWDSADIKSGLYLYSLQTETFIQSKRMLLQR